LERKSGYGYVAQQEHMNGQSTILRNEYTSFFLSAMLFGVLPKSLVYGGCFGGWIHKQDDALCFVTKLMIPPTLPCLPTVEEVVEYNLKG